MQDALLRSRWFCQFMTTKIIAQAVNKVFDTPHGPVVALQNFNLEVK